MVRGKGDQNESDAGLGFQLCGGDGSFENAVTVTVCSADNVE